MPVKVSHSELKTILRQAYKARKSVMVQGPPGIGKSFTVREFSMEVAKEEGRVFVEWNKLPLDEKYKILEDPSKYHVFIDFRLAQVDPTDLRGLPKLNSKEYVEWRPPMWLALLSKRNCSGVLFLDEINLAPPSVQSSAYQIIYDKALGEISLNEGVFVVGAGNRLEDRANVYEMAKPLQNRFIWCELKVPSIREWTQWAGENCIDPRIIGFLNWKPNLLFKFDPMSKEPTFPTPRTWHFASDLIKGVQDLDLIQLLVATAVGEGASIEFVAFLRLRGQLPHPREVLENPSIMRKFSEDEMDKVISLSTAVVEYVAEKYKEGKRDKLPEKFLNFISVLEPEIAQLCFTMTKSILGKKADNFLLSLLEVKGYEEKVKRFAKYI